jgi:hypothetical protein
MLKHFSTNYRKPANSKEANMQKIVSLLKMVALLAIAAYMLHIFTAGQDNIINSNPTQGREVMDIREAAPHTPDAVMSQKKVQKQCWTMNEDPKAELPGAAVVQFKSGYTKYVTNDTPKGYKLVDAAFNEALAAVGYGDKTSDQIDVIALCI